LTGKQIRHIVLQVNRNFNLDLLLNALRLRRVAVGF